MIYFSPTFLLDEENRTEEELLNAKLMKEISNEMCHVLAIKCFKGIISSFQAMENVELNIKSPKKLKKLYTECSQKNLSFPCSFTNEKGESINFYFTGLQDSENAYVIIFKRDDNKLKNKDLKLFAVIPADEVHNNYKYFFWYKL